MTGTSNDTHRSERGRRPRADGKKGTERLDLEALAVGTLVVISVVQAVIALAKGVI